jgi:hypothetical protein
MRLYPDEYGRIILKYWLIYTGGIARGTVHRTDMPQTESCCGFYEHSNELSSDHTKSGDFGTSGNVTFT